MEHWLLTGAAAVLIALFICWLFMSKPRNYPVCLRNVQLTLPLDPEMY